MENLKPPADRSLSLSLSQVGNLVIIALLAGNLYVFGRIAAGIGDIAEQLSRGALTPMLVPVPVPGELPSPGAGTGATTNAATASGNVVHVDASSSRLPDGPRTVEQVAAYLGVTPDTVRESYIPDWIEAGEMADDDRTANRWMIPDRFTPYRTK